MGLKQIFEKQGGMKLIGRYFKGGALGTAMSQFLILGKSRTALELLRESTQLKIKQKLYNRYKDVLFDFDKNFTELIHEKSNKVWICWFQGMDNAPLLVKKCFQFVKENMTDREIIVITEDNILEYVDFPDYIIEKWKKGIITHTHMTDLLRLELLIRYGGIWMDATVLCTEKEKDIPKYFLDSDLFFFQVLKPGRDGHSSYISSWYMCAQTNNKILSATKKLCYEYWKTNNDMWDYYLLHDFFSIVLDYYADDWNRIVPRDNAAPHILLLRLFDEYDEQMFEYIKKQTPFHKLSYKNKKEDEQKENTFFDVIIRR